MTDDLDLIFYSQVVVIHFETLIRRGYSGLFGAKFISYGWDFNSRI